MPDILKLVQRFRLLPYCPAHTHRVVPDDAGEDERHGELHGLKPQLVPDNDEERRDERRMRARETARPEECQVPFARADILHKHLYDLAENHHHQRNEEEVVVEKIVEGLHGKDHTTKPFHTAATSHTPRYGHHLHFSTVGVGTKSFS